MKHAQDSPDRESESGYSAAKLAAGGTGMNSLQRVIAEDNTRREAMLADVAKSLRGPTVELAGLAAATKFFVKPQIPAGFASFTAKQAALGVHMSGITKLAAGGTGMNSLQRVIAEDNTRRQAMLADVAKSLRGPTIELAGLAGLRDLTTTRQPFAINGAIPEQIEEAPNLGAINLHDPALDEVYAEFSLRSFDWRQVAGWVGLALLAELWILLRVASPSASEDLTRFAEFLAAVLAVASLAKWLR